LLVHQLEILGTGSNHVQIFNIFKGCFVFIADDMVESPSATKQNAYTKFD
jgi:hypothetical protein